MDNSSGTPYELQKHVETIKRREKDAQRLMDVLERIANPNLEPIRVEDIYTYIYIYVQFRISCSPCYFRGNARSRWKVLELSLSVALAKLILRLDEMVVEKMCIHLMQN